MTSAWVAEPMSTDDGREGRTLATLAFALGVWGMALGILNIMFGIGGSGEHKLKVVWAAYLSVGQLYPDLYVDDMVYRPMSDTVFMILTIGLTAWGGSCLHKSTEGGIVAWIRGVFTCDSWLSLMSTKEAGEKMTVAMWCILLGIVFYVYQSIVHWNWVDVGVYSVTAALLGFGCALMFAAQAESQE
ncbi:MAG: hypothetical protein VYA86_06820 [Candidatus Thermoplasmatota archaeon]|nr:hypothetical protein [Candidatus Thermoplasmatota archaeon]